ncbi:hypothetical protein H6F98_22675 [Microcoleus sp. FACHB-SPT15]|uniref:hypothetical protein n=1 Tax=Microcoleus sp. FACHB-SPT15 TaxID=2692830 RepID=UPI0017856201|nr:hypothetical protein [Microcoleus sp. FACHB-SPT15]MBD1808236.1 hypothetical protein [Microcoleus sp. FACHB-SPT15]
MKQPLIHKGVLFAADYREQDSHLALAVTHVSCAQIWCYFYPFKRITLIDPLPRLEADGIQASSKDCSLRLSYILYAKG